MRFPLLALLALLTLSQCKKKDEAPDLPAETTTGAMTLGCRVDGRVFVPRDGRGKPGLFVQYVYLGAGKGGGYFLNIPATDWKPNPPGGINITTDSLLVEEGKTYAFKNTKGSPQASYSFGTQYIKLDQDPGELTITRFDPSQGIVSGRFHFVGTDPATGKQVRVTDGRFDVRF
ncbi:DUF6252 family protein [Hymenobacter sp. IS2118]|uniref:DUF6252 family protein n=1 Tax=Hymenobacter sp. IS2118 TaxID=1505605 RepID=UPI0005572B56|nr:DUF6252 family protein [Hymenobacter sp. IS2118]